MVAGKKVPKGGSSKRRAARRSPLSPSLALLLLRLCRKRMEEERIRELEEKGDGEGKK